MIALMVATLATPAVRIADVTRRRPAAVWMVTRLIAASVSLLGERAVRGDVDYYRQSLHAMFGGVPLADTLREYPLPALATIVPQYLVALGHPARYEIVFLFSMLAVDAAFAWRLRRGADGLAVWIWFVPLLGPLSWFRLDLVPAVLLGVALLVARARPVRAGIALAVGTGLKVWPAAVLPALLAAPATRLRMLAGSVTTGLVLVAVSVALGGVDRLVSPLTWQADRGLQIESIAATPLVVAWSFHPDGVWRVFRSRYQASEIHGAGSAALLVLVTVSTVLAAAVVVALWWRLWRAPGPDGVPAGWVTVATVLLLIVTNKTLSPQYLLWWGAPVAVLASGLIGRPDTAASARAMRRQVGGALVLAVLTQLEYPVFYQGFLASGGWRLPVATLFLTLRNVGLVVLTVAAVRLAWRETSRRPTGQR